MPCRADHPDGCVDVQDVAVAEDGVAQRLAILPRGRRETPEVYPMRQVVEKPDAVDRGDLVARPQPGRQAYHVSLEFCVELRRVVACRPHSSSHRSAASR